MSSKPGVPYAQASSGGRARGEVITLLRQFGCESVGFMDGFTDQSLMLAFQWRGASSCEPRRRVGQPCTSARIRGTTAGAPGKRIGSSARSSRGWWPSTASCGKGQVTAIESGLLAFDQVFLPYMVTDTGETVAERISKDTLLIEDRKVT